MLHGACQPWVSVNPLRTGDRAPGGDLPRCVTGCAVQPGRDAQPVRVDNVLRAMPFRVRTPDGELSYPTLLDVERAFHQGLVDPEDEVLDETTGSVHQAKEHPLLRAPPPRRFWHNQGAQPARIAVALSLALSALIAGAVQQWWLALPAAGAAAFMTVRIAVTAHVRPRDAKRR
jgi:hypothetical protein